MKQWFFPLAIFLGSLFLYLYTLCPSVPLQGDAGELVAVAYTLGIAHPPGYPLYTMLAHLFTYLPINSVAWRVNFFSALTSSLTLIFVYQIIFTLTKKKFVALITAGIIGLSQTFWLYSVVAEVFSLNNLFVTIVIYLAVLIDKNTTDHDLKKQFYLLSAIFGLSLSNHSTMVFIIPGLLYFLWPKIKKVFGFKFFIIVCLTCAAGLLPYLFILFRAKTAILPVAWSYPENFYDLLRIMIRADYGTFSPALNLNPAMATISDKADQLSKFFSYFIEDFGWSVGILSAVGLLAGIRKKLRITIFLAIFFFLSGIFFISYANFPIDDPSGFGLVCVERFYLLPYLIAGLLSGLGINILSVFVKNSRLLSVIFNIFLVFCLVMILISNFSVVNQSQNYFGLKFGQNILKNLPKDALIVNQGDLPIFVTFYARYVEGFRSDVEIMTANASGIQNNFRYLKKTRPQFNWQSSGTATVSEVIEANFQKVPIYWFGPVGIDVPGTLASPSGLLFNFFPPEKAQDFAQWEHENRQILVSYDLPSPSQIQQNDTIADYSLVWYYARMFSTLGNFCGKNFHYDCARDFFQSAIKFDPYALPKHFGLAKAYELGKNCAKAEEEYRHILKLNSEANVIYFELANLARTCFKDEAKAKYFEEQMAGKQIGLNDSLEGL